jgi:formylglycine-generating enzyme required for sulfatase activity
LRQRAAIRASATTWALFSMLACSEPFTTAGSAGVDAAGPPPDAGAADRVGAPTDAPPDALPSQEASSDATAPCPAGRGSAMVAVPTANGQTFCIDSTEATKSQYLAFLSATDVGPQPAVCAGNASYVPQNSWPPGAGEGALPVNWVDWCDALAYCTWAGKRLCGAIGGGPITTDQTADPTASAWFHACSHGGAYVAPFGSDPAGACNSQAANGQLLPVGTTKTCEGGFPGLFDMVGNVAEWIDVCQTSSDGMDQCWLQGGSYADPTQDCQNTYQWVRTETDYDYGIRCCGP